LSITLFKLSVLDVEKDLYNIMCDWLEWLFSDRRTDDCNGFNDLTSELFVLWLEELIKVSN